MANSPRHSHVSGRHARRVASDGETGVAARPLERKHALEYGCKLFTQAISQHAPCAVKPRFAVDDV